MNKPPPETETIVQLPQKALRPRETNRTDLQLDDGFLADIKTNGVRQPLIVRPLAKPHGAVTHEIVCGERRWTANGRAGRETIPALVRPLVFNKFLKPDPDKTLVPTIFERRLRYLLLEESPKEKIPCCS